MVYTNFFKLFVLAFTPNHKIPYHSNHLTTQFQNSNGINKFSTMLTNPKLISSKESKTLLNLKADNKLDFEALVDAKKYNLSQETKDTFNELLYRNNNNPLIVQYIIEFYMFMNEMNDKLCDDGAKKIEFKYSTNELTKIQSKINKIIKDDDKKKLCSSIKFKDLKNLSSEERQKKLQETFNVKKDIALFKMGDVNKLIPKLKTEQEKEMIELLQNLASLPVGIAFIPYWGLVYSSIIVNNIGEELKTPIKEPILFLSQALELFSRIYLYVTAAPFVVGKNIFDVASLSTLESNTLLTRISSKQLQNLLKYSTDVCDKLIDNDNMDEEIKKIIKDNEEYELGGFSKAMLELFRVINNKNVKTNIRRIDSK